MAEIIEFGRDADTRKITKTPKVDGPPEQREVGTEAEAKQVAKKPIRSSRAAVAMKVSGASYEDIADVLEYASPAAARMAVEKALADSVDADTDYRSLRAVASLQLDGLLKATFPKARNTKDPDQLAYVRMALSIVDRKIKLHGVDAPQMITIIDPGAEEFERVIALAATRMGPQVAPEGDIFELEQAPDGETWGPADGEP